MKQFFLGALVTIALLAVGGFLFLRLGFAEVRADVPPSKLETYVMSTSVHASVRRHAEEVRNPIEPTDENLLAGGKMYLNECSGCHGTPGKVQKNADPLRPPPPPLAVTEYTEAQVFWVAKHGIRMSGMFANACGIPIRSCGLSPLTSSG